jgi:outer membrane protein assembly factor BamE (lipoprotein component of BamABCDE complex)
MSGTPSLVRRLLYSMPLVALLAFSGCSHGHPVVVEEAHASSILPDLVEGKTTKEDVLFMLGIPSAMFEGERIFSYRMIAGEDDKLVVVPREISHDDVRLSTWKNAEYSLVLSFNDRHILQRKGLVRVR